MSTKLTDADIDLLASQWWAQHDKPIEPMLSCPLPLVPFSDLPHAGVGAIMAGAIREAIRAGEESEGREFVGFGGSLCMNCGSRRPEVSANGGYCDRCER